AGGARPLGPERPGRAVPGHVFAQIGLDLRLAHAGEEIPGAGVGAHVLQAGMVILAQPLARLGRAEITAELAVGPVAQAPRRLAGARRVQLDLAWGTTLAHGPNMPIALPASKGTPTATTALFRARRGPAKQRCGTCRGGGRRASATPPQPGMTARATRPSQRPSRPTAGSGPPALLGARVASSHLGRTHDPRAGHRHADHTDDEERLAERQRSGLPRRRRGVTWPGQCRPLRMEGRTEAAGLRLGIVQGTRQRADRFLVLARRD